MNAIIALLAIAVLFGIVYLGMGAAHLGFVFGVVLPYAAIALGAAPTPIPKTR